MRQLHFLALLLLPGERSGGSTASSWWQSCCQLPSSPLSSLPPSLWSGNLVPVLTTTTQVSPTIPTTAVLVQTASTVLSATGKILLTTHKWCITASSNSNFCHSNWWFVVYLRCDILSCGINANCHFCPKCKNCVSTGYCGDDCGIENLPKKIRLYGQTC